MVQTALLVVRTTSVHHRFFSTTSSSRASIFFALSSLSNSRETQHFNKLSRLPRVEHSPSLKLIKTSEIDTFTPPATPAEQAPSATNLMLKTDSTFDDVMRAWDVEALNVGRAVIAGHARQSAEMRDALDEMRRREVQREAAIAEEREAWQKESRHLRNEIRVAGVWILVSIGTATGLAAWRFWPRGGAKTVTAAAPVAAGVGETSVSTAGLRAREVVVPAVESVAVTRPVIERMIAEPVNVVSSEVGGTSSWWRSLFWKQA